MGKSHLNLDPSPTRCGNVESHNGMSEIGSTSKIALTDGVWMKFKYSANESIDCGIHKQTNIFQIQAIQCQPHGPITSSKSRQLRKFP